MARGGIARNLVHTPAELATEYVEWAQSIRDNPGIPFGVPSVDKKVIPMRPGELISLIGRPGSAKTSLMAYLAKRTAVGIQERGASEIEAVVYVTWEQSAEELANFFLADGDYDIGEVAWGRMPMEKVMRQAVHGGKIPLWVIGHGIGRAGLKVPRMTPDVVLSAIESMEEDFGVKPILMCFDYMQLIPVANIRDRVQQVTEAPIRIKELALRIGCPALVAVQASRNVDERQVKLPGMADAQWASSIEQTSDKAFGLWRPATTEKELSLIPLDGEDHIVCDTLLIMRMLKQRGASPNGQWALYFHPALMQLAAMVRPSDQEPRRISSGR